MHLSRLFFSWWINLDDGVKYACYTHFKENKSKMKTHFKPHNETFCFVFGFRPNRKRNEQKTNAHTIQINRDLVVLVMAMSFELYSFPIQRRRSKWITHN